MWVPICLYCSNCTKFDQLILRKIIKIFATRCQILRLKIQFRLWLHPIPQLDLRGHTSKGREGEEGREGKRRERVLSLPKENFLVTSL